MARAYFIGGAPRVGKSTVAAMFLASHSAAFASTDDLRTALRRKTSPAQQPDLYYLDSLNSNELEMARLMREGTADIIAAADRESAVVWPAVDTFVRENLAAGRDVLVEGVAILPHFVAQLDIDYSVIYLGNQSPAHGQIIQNHASKHPDTWLATLQPDTIAAFAEFVRATSAHIESEAAKHGQPYLEMSSLPFPTALDQAFNSLTNEKRPR